MTSLPAAPELDRPLLSADPSFSYALWLLIGTGDEFDRACARLPTSKARLLAILQRQGAPEATEAEGWIKDLQALSNGKWEQEGPSFLSALSHMKTRQAVRQLPGDLPPLPEGELSAEQARAALLDLLAFFSRGRRKSAFANFVGLPSGTFSKFWTEQKRLPYQMKKWPPKIARFDPAGWEKGQTRFAMLVTILERADAFSKPVFPKDAPLVPEGSYAAFFNDATRGMTTKEILALLSPALDAPLSPDRLSKYRRGVIKPRHDMAVAFATVFARTLPHWAELEPRHLALLETLDGTQNRAPWHSTRSAHPLPEIDFENLTPARARAAFADMLLFLKGTRTQGAMAQALGISAFGFSAIVTDLSSRVPSAVRAFPDKLPSWDAAAWREQGPVFLRLLDALRSFDLIADPFNRKRAFNLPGAPEAPRPPLPVPNLPEINPATLSPPELHRELTATLDALRRGVENKRLAQALGLSYAAYYLFHTQPERKIPRVALSWAEPLRALDPEGWPTLGPRFLALLDACAARGLIARQKNPVPLDLPAGSFGALFNLLTKENRGLKELSLAPQTLAYYRTGVSAPSYTKALAMIPVFAAACGTDWTENEEAFRAMLPTLRGAPKAVRAKPVEPRPAAATAPAPRPQTTSSPKPAAPQPATPRPEAPAAKPAPVKTEPSAQPTEQKKPAPRPASPPVSLPRSTDAPERITTVAAFEPMARPGALPRYLEGADLRRAQRAARQGKATPAQSALNQTPRPETPAAQQRVEKAGASANATEQTKATTSAPAKATKDVPWFLKGNKGRRSARTSHEKPTQPQPRPASPPRRPIGPPREDGSIAQEFLAFSDTPPPGVAAQRFPTSKPLPDSFTNLYNPPKGEVTGKAKPAKPLTYEDRPTNNRVPVVPAPRTELSTQDEADLAEPLCAEDLVITSLGSDFAGAGWGDDEEGSVDEQDYIAPSLFDFSHAQAWYELAHLCGDNWKGDGVDGRLDGALNLWKKQCDSLPDDKKPGPPAPALMAWRQNVASFVKDLRNTTKASVPQLARACATRLFKNPRVWHKIEANDPCVPSSLFADCLSEVCQSFMLETKPDKAAQQEALMQAYQTVGLT